MPEINNKIINDALKKGKLEKRTEEITYYRFKEDLGKIPRGTVVLKDRAIFGFPHIKRIFILGKGITRNIKSDDICIEEKIDGYNLRIAYVNGKIFAFSRGGFIDFFATEKAREIINKKFFSDFPNYVLCCEMIGNTPYTKPVNGYDVKLFVFDINNGKGDYLDCNERYTSLKKYGIESVPIIAKLKKNETKKIRNIALNLLKGKKEGMVIKSRDRKDIVKFVTPFADIDDISNNTTLMFDMPLGFFNQRVLRSAFFIKDFELDHTKFVQELGNAFYEKFISKLEALEIGEEISEEFEILIKDAGIFNWVKRHMSREVKIEKIFEREENGKTRIRFRKIYKRTNRELKNYLNGGGVTD